jgi:hypothetical protein
MWWLAAMKVRYSSNAAKDPAEPILASNNNLMDEQVLPLERTRDSDLLMERFLSSAELDSRVF